MATSFGDSHFILSSWAKISEFFLREVVVKITTQLL